MWIEVKEIVDFDRTVEPPTPITHGVHINTRDIIMMRKQLHGTELYIKNTWIYVTDTVDQMLVVV